MAWCRWPRSPDQKYCAGWGKKRMWVFERGVSEKWSFLDQNWDNSLKSTAQKCERVWKNHWWQLTAHWHLFKQTPWVSLEHLACKCMVSLKYVFFSSLVEVLWRLRFFVSIDLCCEGWILKHVFQSNRFNDIILSSCHS